MDCINQRGYSSITDQYNDFIAATTSAETQQMPESYTIYLHQSCLFQPTHVRTCYVVKDRTYWTVEPLTAKCFT